MQRVMIIGCCGAGKSTLARKLADRTQLPLIHPDGEYWKPGWTSPDANEWVSKVSALVSQPAWIMDGNYGGTLPLRVAGSSGLAGHRLIRQVGFPFESV
jgi:adenylate kinase family enzyme